MSFDEDRVGKLGAPSEPERTLSGHSRPGHARVCVRHQSLPGHSPFAPRRIREAVKAKRSNETPGGRRLIEDEGGSLADWAPAVDVQETNGEYLIKADLPEVRKDDVQVEIQDGMLCLQGERRQEKEEKGKKFHRIERAYGRFERRLALPNEVDALKVEAEFKDGVLKVHLPKSAGAQPRTVEVKVS